MTEMSIDIKVLTEAFAEPVMTLDKDLCITSWNSMCTAMCGRQPEAVLQQPFYAVFPQAADNAHLALALHHALAGHHTFLSSEECSYTEGYFDNHFAPLRNEQGEIRGVLHSRHDVAHRIMAVEETKKLNKDLTKLNKELTFVNNAFKMMCKAVGEDLYKPVRKIHYFTELIAAREEPGLSRTGSSYFSRIKNYIGQIEKMIADLHFYALETDELEQNTSIDLNRFCKFIIRDLNAQLESCNARVSVASLPHIQGRRSMLFQLFRQLMGNAVKFRDPQHQLEINIYAEGCDRGTMPDEYCSIVIEDNGLGFPERQQEAIFGLFARGYNAQRHPGNGIGLALCKKIAEAHGGYITAYNNGVSGSRFVVHLPFQAPAV